MNGENMNDELVRFLIDMFFKLEKEGKDAFILIKFSVPMGCFLNLYERLVLVDVPPLETLPVVEKEKYWNIAKTFYPDKEQAIKASKAAYMLSLITNS
jgi:hypothetical protein